MAQPWLRSYLNLPSRWVDGALIEQARGGFAVGTAAFVPGAARRRAFALWEAMPVLPAVVRRPLGRSGAVAWRAAVPRRLKRWLSEEMGVGVYPCRVGALDGAGSRDDAATATEAATEGPVSDADRLGRSLTRSRARSRARDVKDGVDDDGDDVGDDDDDNNGDDKDNEAVAFAGRGPPRFTGRTLQLPIGDVKAVLLRARLEKGEEKMFGPDAETAVLEVAWSPPSSSPSSSLSSHRRHRRHRCRRRRPCCQSSNSVMPPS